MKCIYTSIFNEHDKPIEISPQFRKGWDCILFTDRPLGAPGWTVRVVDPVQVTGQDNPRRAARHFKIRWWEYVGAYSQSLWVDGNIQVVGDLNKFTRDHCMGGARFVTRKHPDRNCAYVEAAFCAEHRKDAPAVLEAQANRYSEAGFPTRNGLYETCHVWRAHDDWNRKLGAAWWDELARASFRDQVSLPFVLFTQGASIDQVDRDAYDPFFRRMEHVKRNRMHTRPADIAGPAVEPEHGFDAAPDLAKIDVRIPFDASGNLGEEYNRIMAETPLEWVLFLDHDVLLLHPSWYHVAQRCIARHGHDAGIFTAWTNNIGCRQQLHQEAPAPDMPIPVHRAFARALWDRHGFECSCIDDGIMSGFFILTSKTAWKKAGGFSKGFFKVDNNYHRAMKKAGLKTLRMDGVYGYHLRDRSGTPWIEGVKISRSFVKKKG